MAHSPEASGSSIEKTSNKLIRLGLFVGGIALAASLLKSLIGPNLPSSH